MQWCDDVCMMSVCVWGGGGHWPIPKGQRARLSARGKTGRVSAGEQESRIVSVMQGAEGMGKGCQLVTVCKRKECHKGAG